MTTTPTTPFTPRPGPVVLCILDGVGLGAGDMFDAVATARTPTLDHLMAHHPWLPLQAHGTAVGLPSDADMGNSEVGHNAMGAGRVFEQGAKLVDDALATGAAFETPLWRQLTSARALHLIGLVSDGNVHSHIAHLDALLDRAWADGVPKVRLHLLTDGRDVARQSALTWVKPLQDRMDAARAAGRDWWIASGGGRMHITMDRYDADWAMVARGWACHVHGQGRPFSDAVTAIRTLYAEQPEPDDQWLPAFVITENGEPVGRIGDGDAVLFFNFRGDRAVEISRAFTEPDLDRFDRGVVPNVLYAGMMQYDGDLMLPANYLVAPPAIDRTVGEYLAAAGRRTFACSETQKFGHVTFFFNGNRSGKLDDALETFVEIPSDTRPFDERPWMKAAEICDAVIDAVASNRYDHVRLNLANGDMVGHTGELEPTRVAVEAVDLQVARLMEAVRAADGILLVTADHGNADDMVQRKKSGDPLHDGNGNPMPRTSHTLNLVPFIVFDPRDEVGVISTQSPPSLAAVGATVLALCGLETPEGYLPPLVQPAR